VTIAPGFVDWASWDGNPVVISDQGLVIGRGLPGRVRLAPSEHRLTMSSPGWYISTVNRGDTAGGPPP
jgi:hypothetical protein